MSASTFTPKPVCLNSTQSSHFCKPSKPVSGFQVKFKAKSQFSNRFISGRTYATLADPFVLEIADALQDSVSSLSLSSSSLPVPLQKIRDVSADSLLSLKWPSRKDEAFRFTDMSFLRSSQIHPVASPPLDIGITRSSEDAQLPNLVIVDGYAINSLSNLSALPDGVFVGSLSDLPSEAALQKVHDFVSNFEGDLFWLLNGVGAPDVTVIYIPEGCQVDTPVHIKYYSAEVSDDGSNNLPVSNPRVLVFVEKGGYVGIIEEYLGADETKCYWANSVLEVVIEQEATVSHSYVQRQSLGAAHIKWTSVTQEAASTYKLVEVSCGGKLSRHNVHVQQVGPDTITELSTLHLSVGDQTQDLHSRLVLDHPRGYCRQLHKCIVAHSQGHGVFDGNIDVNRFAQQTDAGQLTRNLLLVPRATVNGKPNLTIEADDVQCTHGLTVSSLEADQLFYFQARGVDSETAKKALIYSFGAEVIERFPHSFMRDKMKSLVADVLEPTLATSSSA
ncbi:hypothetical protein V2J09_001213 [Rumex salicifolius]